MLLVRPQGSQAEVVTLLFLLTKHLSEGNELAGDKVEEMVVEEDNMMGRVRSLP